MATFRKRGPYQWQVQVRKKGYPVQSKTFETRAAASVWARTIEHEMDAGSFVSRVAADSTTLGELIDRYVDVVTPTKKGAISEAYRLRAIQHHALAQRFIFTLRGADFARYRDERLPGVSPSTVRRDLSCLSHVFEVARKEWDVYVANPIKDIKLPRDNRPRDRRLEPGEEPRLFDACRSARNRSLFPVVRLALETAMRREILSLRWEDVDLGRRTAYLRETKNGTSRTVPV